MYHFYKGKEEGKEFCFNIEATEPLDESELKILKYLLAEGFIINTIKDETQLDKNKEKIVELGPRLNFATASSTNAVGICYSVGLKKIKRIEISRRYLFKNDVGKSEFIKNNHDMMTECVYNDSLVSFETGIKPKPVFFVLLIEEGIEAIKKINKDMGLGMDEWDENFYFKLFAEDLKRNPTNVECFQLGQANSEHSRHWFFKGKLVIDGKEKKDNLLDIIFATLKANKENSLIAYKDNSSVIKGYDIISIIPEIPGKASKFVKKNLKYHILLTAETHNFPSGVAPFPGAETGTGGRIRDVQATGRGALVVAGTAGYCVGNLNIPNYELPWEDKNFKYPDNLATPLKIEIEASNGASDYGNKFGEPLIQGYTRSFGMILPDKSRQEWVKPIMFTGGVGQIDDKHIEKDKAKTGMIIIQIGGPAYRIGMGGGSASSMIQGENIAELDFNAVQRGDAEMEQKMNRVIRACVELGNKNPIVSIHDQGAGGPCNVLTELVEPVGGRIEIRKIKIGDNTLSVLEIWGAEYQERNALLIKPEKLELFTEICVRERADFEILGKITGDGRIVVHDEEDDSTPVNLELEKILGKMPQKTFKDNHIKIDFKPLDIPNDLNFKNALKNVLRLLSVGSKRFLTSKVDRSVTGLIARQQCVGPLQLTLSDVSVIAQSHFSKTGTAISIGEQPMKMIINPRAGARMSVAEALTNMVWARISNLEHIKCSGNWMWAAKLPGEASRIYDAAVAMRDIMIELGIAIDGGKDSLSMATKIKDEIVKSPGELTISAYATMPDIEKVITPDIKRSGESELWFLDINKKYRMGGSALAQTLKQLGEETPDVENAEKLKDLFKTIQEMIDKNVILAGHDRSDGGLITTILEMAFAGNCGLDINIDTAEENVWQFYFNEEVGLVVEIAKDKREEFQTVIDKYDLGSNITLLGKTTISKDILIKHNQEIILKERMIDLRKTWEETSSELEKKQTDMECAQEEYKNIINQRNPEYKLSFDPKVTPQKILNKEDKPKVAIIREEGSNGDREMTTAFFAAGFEPWDIMMADLLSKKITLNKFRGIVFVGGFSYADVLSSAKGWASTIRFNESLRVMFDDFYNRPDTFSLGVCNGCQLMGLLGWVPWRGIEDKLQPRFIQNNSKRFESRWITTKILTSPAIMLKDMEGSSLGIWIAHGEGKLHFPDNKIKDEIINKKLAPIVFADDDNKPTEKYPFNPNGSPEGITALCSQDGRHLAMMPHPERVFLKWQWPYMSEKWKKELEASPWLKMFQNAREWC